MVKILKGAGIYWMLCWCSKGGNGVGKFSAAVGVDQSLVCGNRIESCVKK